MNYFKLIAFLCVICVGWSYQQAEAAVKHDDVNAPAALKSEPNDSNAGDANNSNELFNVAEIEGQNTSDGYISGDVFNIGFSEVFKKYVNQQGLVNYSKLRRFRLELNDAVDKLANLKPEVYITWSKNEKIAFWINAYNICTMKGIVDNYPISPSRFMLLFYPADSVMHLRGLRDSTYFMIMGIQYTLEEIEKDVLLGRFEDARICFAVNYGTLGSSALRMEPYIGKVLDKQLDRQAQNYFVRPDGLRIDEVGNIVYLSPIFKMFKWHEDAFLKQYGTNKLFRDRGPVDRALLNFIKDYVSSSNAQYLKKRTYTIEYLKYDWQLNEQAAQ